jgi:SNF2 family DNA or RNA helicase
MKFDDGRELYKFQAENLDFIYNVANNLTVGGDRKIRALIADDTGLGKTITACGVIKESGIDVYPILIICMTTLKIQFMIELFNTNSIFGQIIYSNKIKPEDRWKCHIISYDLLKKYNYIDMLKPKLIIIDECQRLKNWDSARTGAIVEFCEKINPHIIMTSATPIENNAGEFYPAFHILRPDRFYNQSDFIRMCDSVKIGTNVKLGGISPYWLDRFKNMTKDIMIRHRRHEVYKDLPKSRISHKFVKIEEEKDIESLKRETESFIELYDRIETYDDECEDESKENMRMKLNAAFMRIRHIVGDAKVPHILEGIYEFLESYESDRKLTVFIHHKSVAQALINDLEINKERYRINSPFAIRGGMNENERNNIIAACTVNKGWPTNDNHDRIMIASTLGIPGVNLQKCYDAFMGERQFNPPKEEQAAPGRFSRPGAELITDSIFVTYYTALETIDEYLNQIVESKRGGLHKTMGDEEGEISFDEQGLQKQLMDRIASEGRKWIKKGF